MNTNKSRLLRMIGAGAIGVGSMFMNPSAEPPYLSMGMPTAYADTIYYTTSSKPSESKTPAYIVFESIKKESKYTKELEKMKENDARKSEVAQKRDTSVYWAISQIAQENKYDIVVEKGDPELKDYKNITKTVLEKMKENEKNGLT